MESLSIFFNRVAENPRMSTSQISLYVVLYTEWLSRGARISMPLDRETVMARARIISKPTYYKCLRDLADWGFIDYKKDMWKGRKSEVRIR